MKKLLFCLSLLFVMTAFSTEKSADPRIKGLLEELKLQYEEKESAIIVRDNKLTIFILHEKINALGIRGFQIWAVIPYKGTLTNDMLKRMMQDTLNSASGSWGLLDKYPVFKILIGENCTKEELAIALIAGLKKAESFEQNIVNGK